MCSVLSSSSPITDHMVSLTKKRKYDTTLDLLECPVCFELPRSGPLFGCKNGHLLCKLCRNQLMISTDGGQCPICRSKDLSCRNIIAEKLLEDMLQKSNLSFECRFSTYGCPERADGPTIEKHEVSCWFRFIDCPSSHLGSCSWRGPLKNLVKHVASSKCAQVLKTNTPTNQFSSSICDFPAANSVFNRTANTFWKPVLLFSPLTVRFFIYITISRDQNGVWRLCAKSYAPHSIIEALSIEIHVTPIYEIDKSYTFRGKIESHNVSNKNLSGNYLLLFDDQVKSLSKGNKLFQYSIKVNKVISKPLSEDLDCQGLCKTNETV
ncbi:uncharacterized protein [Lepeophtheirus salmonis]|uniref:RING-type E3 ubiquitin transferase n=1 Tax=Lepeophtheirus salmonis TaxID=72036 RepID=A0A0K2V1Z1_LEPSM|nr:uncharacterized protein LOC121114403 isoform X2 [Lepeophtheirus salmonis]